MTKREGSLCPFSPAPLSGRGEIGPTAEFPPDFPAELPSYSHKKPPTQGGLLLIKLDVGN